MPPFFKMSLELNKDLLARVRELPIRSQRNIRRKIVTVLGPELQTKVDQLLTNPPGPVSDPFVFGSTRSRIFYILMVREHPDLTDGEHWIRKDIIENGFRVEVSDRLRVVMVRIRNIQPKGRYVYGPWQVQGHANTGWGKGFNEILAELQKWLNRRVRELWREAVREAVKGRG